MKATQKNHPISKWPLASWCIALLICLLIASCKDKCDLVEDRDVREDMRTLVREISAEGRRQKPGFIVIANNGLDLLTDIPGDPDASLASDYIDAIDAVMFESLYYGWNNNMDNETKGTDRIIPRKYLERAREAGLTPMVIDFCKKEPNVDDSYESNARGKYLSYASNSIKLNFIPDYPTQLHGENGDDVNQLSEAHNFLHLNRFDKLGSKQDILNKIGDTNYDVVIMDAFYSKEETFTSSDLDQIRDKPRGGRRLLIGYMSIGEAENYRYYWQDDWEIGSPSYLVCKGYDKSNIRVTYWEQAWKDILFDSTDSYLQKIIGAGFDGVFLDVVDAYQSFEKED